MSDETQQSHTQQFEHAIATAFTCRSVIKYNSSLNEEQKNEILAGIDTTVKFLQDRLVANASIEAHMVLPQLQPTGVLPTDQLTGAGSDEAGGKASAVGEANEEKYKHKLRALYRISQSYLDSKAGLGIDGFITRFNKAMTAIDEVQSLFMQSRDVDGYPDQTYIENLLHRLRGLIADMYSVFIEFARAISNTLHGSDIYIETEKLSSMHQERPAGEEKQGIQDISPLLKVYEAHLQFNRKKGTVASRIADATAFLIFLGESLDNDFNKREEVIVQLNKIAKLLNDLSFLLSNYASTMSALIQHE